MRERINHISGSVCTANQCHGHTCEINTAIQNVDLYFTTNLCATILNFDCSSHIIDHDEQICGSDGVTYDNHCLFTQARCKASTGLHEHQQVIIGVQNHGSCILTLAPSTAIPEVTTAMTDASTMPVAVSTTQLPATATGSNSASMDVVTNGSSAGMVTSTQSPAITTTSQSNGSTTTDPVGAIVHNVFCKNAPTLNCQGFNINIVCGTDGKFYPNNCELLKQACKDPSLTISGDFNSCSATSN